LLTLKTDTSDNAQSPVGASHILSGHYSHPVRVVGFNTAEGWARDVTEEIAYTVFRLKRRVNNARRLSLRTGIVHFLLLPSKMFFPRDRSAATRFQFTDAVSASKTDSQRDNQ
jgi:hypothetical protein